MYRCVWSTSYPSGSGEEQKCYVREMSFTPILQIYGKPSIKIWLFVLMILAMVELVVGQAYLPEPLPSVYIRCDDQDEEGSVKEKAILNRVLTDPSSLRMRQKLLRETLRITRTKEQELKDKIERLKKSLMAARKRRKNLKQSLKMTRNMRLRQRLLTRRSASDVSVGRRRSVARRSVESYSTRRTNDTEAWLCQFSAKSYTTRGYPEIITTGLCTSTRCGGLNDLYRCVEQTYRVPYLKIASPCVYTVSSRRNRRRRTKVRRYQFEWYEAVVGCNCERRV